MSLFNKKKKPQVEAVRSEQVGIVRSEKIELTPGTLNEEERTVEVVFSTGAERLMMFRGGVVLESLEISEKAIRASLLDVGVSVLDSHVSDSVDDVLGCGVPGSFRIEGGRAVCSIKFSKNDRGKKAFEGVSDGTLRFVSAGYNVYCYEEVEGEGVRHLRAVDWEPVEISLVSIPADAGARFRSNEEAQMVEPQIIKVKAKGRSEMKNEEKAGVETQIEQAPKFEQERDNSSEIVNICAIAGLDIRAARDYISRGFTFNQVSDAILARKEAETPDVQSIDEPITEVLEGVVHPNSRSIFKKLNGGK